MGSRAMKTLALLAVVMSAAYYYHLQHPETVAKLLAPRSTPRPAARAHAAATPKPQLHYHSPLDASNSRSSSGYFSAEPPERYETTGQRSTASGRAALLDHPADNVLVADEDAP